MASMAPSSVVPSPPRSCLNLLKNRESVTGIPLHPDVEEIVETSRDWRRRKAK